LGAASYANTSAPVITTTLEVGAVGNNVTVNTTAILLGNSTIFSTVNSTVFSQTANNATNLGGTVAASYANTTNTSATNITAGTLPWAQAPTGTVNTSGAFTITGVQTHTANISVNGAFFANGTNGSIGQILTSGGTGNVYWSTFTSAPAGANTQIAYNNSGSEAGDANLTWTAPSTLFTVGSSATANIGINATSINITSTATIGNTALNTVGLSTGNSITTTTVNSVAINIGNTSTNTLVNSTYLSISTNTGGGFVNATSAVLVICAGNNTTYGAGANAVVANQTAITIGNTTVNTSITPNTITTTQINLPSSTTAANGCCYLPNGLIMNWGWVSTSSTGATTTFTLPFTSNAYNVQVSGNTGATYIPFVTAWTKTGATILTSNTVASNVYYLAIGF
jgi:hypothetical protein